MSGCVAPSAAFVCSKACDSRTSACVALAILQHHPAQEEGDERALGVARRHLGLVLEGARPLEQRLGLGELLEVHGEVGAVDEHEASSTASPPSRCSVASASPAQAWA